MKSPISKQITTLVFCLALISKAFAQDSTAVDSTKHNELNVSFTPGLLFAIGAGNAVKSAAWSIGYRRYLKNDNVFRIGAELYPNSAQGPYQNIVFFARQIDSSNVFTNVSATVSPKTQIFIGFEKLFPTERFMQGFACDAGVYSQKQTFTHQSFWYKNIEAPIIDYSGLYTNGSTATSSTQINNNVDSLTYSYSAQSLGVSLKMLYTVRQKLANNFYLNGSIGPILWLTRNRYTSSSGQKAPRTGFTWVYFDATLFVADVSLSYRF